MAQSRHFEIVIAHYAEDLMKWTPHGEHATIYTKSPPDSQLAIPPKSRLVRLPNHGRDCHTYLHHIVNEYDKLADITLFTQATPFDHLDDGTTIQEMVDRALRTQHGEVQCCRARPTDFWDGFPYPDYEHFRTFLRNKPPMLQSPVMPGQMWKLITGERRHPRRILSIDGAIFAASRSTIQTLPLAAWQRALAFFNDEPHINPEVGLFMEYFWAALLAPLFREYEDSDCERSCCKLTSSDVSDHAHRQGIGAPPDVVAG